MVPASQAALLPVRADAVPDRHATVGGDRAAVGRRGPCARHASRFAAHATSGAENAPKTAAASRTVYVVPAGARCAARTAMPLHAQPDDYVFINEMTGGPINQGEWAREFWHRPLRAAEHPAAEVLRDPPHVHLDRPHRRRQPEVAGRAVRQLGRDDRAALWAVPGGRGRGPAAAARARIRTERPDRSAKRRSKTANPEGQVRRFRRKTLAKRKWSQRESNPCSRRERPVS